MKTTTLLFALAIATALTSCALTSRSEPMRVRYYTLDSAPARSLPGPSHPPFELRLGRIEASGYLGEEIAFRNGQHELEFYDDLRWSEKPQEYLRRALTRALFQERGLTRSYSGMAPTLDVELVEFEELRQPQPKVRLQALVILHDERRSQLEETITVERPIGGRGAAATGRAGAEATAAALSAALSEAVAGLADRVIAQLSAQHSASAHAPASPGSPSNPTQPAAAAAAQADVAGSGASP